MKANSVLTRRLHLPVLAVAIMSFTAPAGAASTPTSDVYLQKPVRLIVPFAPGGTDIIARVIAAQLTTRIGRQVIVENRPGVGGMLGSEYVAKSEPNGHTLLFTSPSIAIGPSLFKLTFDPVKSFKPISKAAKGPLLFTVHASLPVKSVKELIALAKREPGKLVAASSGAGSVVHFAIELFKQTAGIDFLTVHYKGGSEALVALLVGDAQMALNAVTSSLPHVQSGKLRALAFGGRAKSHLLPGVPTISESGLAGYEASTWNGFLAPQGTPSAVIERLHQDLVAVLQQAETKKAVENQGMEVDPLGSAEFGDFIAAETVKWAKVARNMKATDK